MARRVRSGQVTWGGPLVLAFIRLPLVAVGVGVLAMVTHSLAPTIRGN